MFIGVVPELPIILATALWGKLGAARTIDTYVWRYS